jgi:hypothetical protein
VLSEGVSLVELLSPEGALPLEEAVARAPELLRTAAARACRHLAAQNLTPPYPDPG